jgi:hypothetical protein
MGTRETMDSEMMSERVKEQEKTVDICRLVIGGHAYSVDGYSRVLMNPACQVLDASLYAAKVTIPMGSERSAFIQDFAAGLNRRRILANENVETFWALCEEKINGEPETPILTQRSSERRVKR